MDKKSFEHKLLFAFGFEPDSAQKPSVQLYEAVPMHQTERDRLRSRNALSTSTSSLRKTKKRENQRSTPSSPLTDLNVGSRDECELILFHKSFKKSMPNDYLCNQITCSVEFDH